MSQFKTDFSQLCLFRFSLFQKPYGCQLPGCTKRYTDPSSLRKHVKNHAIKCQQNTKKKNTKESEIVQKRFILREPSSDCIVKTANLENNIYIKKEFNFQPKMLNFIDAREQSEMDESTNSIDLMDISKCIMGIGDEKVEYDNYITNAENSDSDEFKIEAIKKYLIEQPSEYIDINSLQSVKQDYFNQF